MPNTPSLVGRGVSVVCHTPAVPAAALARTLALLAAVGHVHEADESLLDPLRRNWLVAILPRATVARGAGPKGAASRGAVPRTLPGGVDPSAADAEPADQPAPGLTIGVAWIDVAAVPGSFIVNTGDMLHRWSNGRFLSTPHRAVNPGGGPRYAIPYFFHPDLETKLAPLPGCVSAGEPARFEPQTVSEFMAHFRRSNYERFRAADAAA
jgi:hypothetical protein